MRSYKAIFLIIIILSLGVFQFHSPTIAQESKTTEVKNQKISTSSKDKKKMKEEPKRKSKEKKFTLENLPPKDVIVFLNDTDPHRLNIARKKLLNMLKDNHPDVIKALIDELKEYPFRKDTAFLILEVLDSYAAWLRDNDKSELLKKLSDKIGTVLVSLVENNIEEYTYSIAARALSTLASMKYTKARKLFIKALDDYEPEMRFAGIRGIYYLNIRDKKVIDKMKELLKKDDAQTFFKTIIQYEVLLLFKRWKYKKIISELKELLDNRTIVPKNEKQLRTHVIYVLEYLTGKKMGPAEGKGELVDETIKKWKEYIEDLEENKKKNTDKKSVDKKKPNKIENKKGKNSNGNK